MNSRSQDSNQAKAHATWEALRRHHFDTKRSQQCTVGVFDQVDAVDRAVDRLLAGNIARQDISIVTDATSDDRLREFPIEAGDEMESRAGMGAGIGGLIGLLLSSPPLLWVTGIAPVLLVGPIAAGVTGAIVGGYIAALSGWGVHADKLKHYQQRVEEGAILVVVSGYPRDVAESQRILRETEAVEVALYARTSADAADINPR